MLHCNNTLPSNFTASPQLLSEDKKSFFVDVLVRNGKSDDRQNALTHPTKPVNTRSREEGVSVDLHPQLPLPYCTRHPQLQQITPRKPVAFHATLAAKASVPERLSSRGVDDPVKCLQLVLPELHARLVCSLGGVIEGRVLVAAQIFHLLRAVPQCFQGPARG